MVIIMTVIMMLLMMATMVMMIMTIWRTQILVITDEVYKYMVYSGLDTEENIPVNGGGEKVGATQEKESTPVNIAPVPTKTTNVVVEGGREGSGWVEAPKNEGLGGKITPGKASGNSAVIGGGGSGDIAEPLPALRHVHFATLPGMWDRTITISSAGKTFSVTGWQVGILVNISSRAAGRALKIKKLNGECFELLILILEYVLVGFACFGGSANG